MGKHEDVKVSVERGYSLPEDDQRGVSRGLHIPATFDEAANYRTSLQQSIEQGYGIVFSDMRPCGTYKFGDGSSGAPSLSWCNDTDTGRYRSTSAPKIVEIVDGTVAMEWDSTKINLRRNTDVVAANFRLITAGSVTLVGYSTATSKTNFNDNAGGNVLTVDHSGSPSITVESRAPLVFNLDATLRLNRQTMPEITADQNDYLIGLSGGTGVFARLTSNAARTITGLAGTADGRVLILCNAGAFGITLAHQNAGSAAANRIITDTGADVVLGVDDTSMLIYDTTTARWRIVTRS